MRRIVTLIIAGVLAAIGRDRVPVFRRPRVAILSTGDEIVQPGEAMRPGLGCDSDGWMAGAVASSSPCLHAGQ